MDGTKKLFFLLSFILFNQPLFAVVSTVYNLRIAEATKQRNIGTSTRNNPFIASVTLFDTFRKRYTGLQENYLGGLLSAVYIPNSWYIKVDWAVANARSQNCDTQFSRTQTDDVLFMGGYSKAFSEKILFTFSALFGIPTHKDLSFEGVQFGTGHYGVGLQMDGSFAVSDDLNHALMTAARYVHFFPETIHFFISKELPSIFRFGSGEVIDLFLAYQGNFSNNHRFEFGYNPTFLFGASICPPLDSVIEKTNFIRSSWYTSYRYLLVTERVAHSFILGLSYGFDHRSKIFGNKNIVTAWFTWGCNW